MSSIPKIPRIPEDQRTPLVTSLLEIIQLLVESNQALKDEIAILKGQKPRPQIKPSKLEKKSEDKELKGGDAKRPGSAKRQKTRELEIHDTMILRAKNVPDGSTRKGYEEFTVQGIRFQAHNILYRRERWLTPAGETIIAPLPKDVMCVGGHFSADLVSYILAQYHQCHVTQPLILEQLLDLGVDISAGQISRILTEGKEGFHAEKDDILRVGLEISDYVHVDDTTARHQGKNGHSTVIGNELFACYESTLSKSRRNFLEIMRAGAKDYVLNAAAFDYMSAQQLPHAQMGLLVGCEKRVFEDFASWKAALDSLGIKSERHIRIATEGALLGSIFAHGSINPNLVILSDDAGQFDVLLHALCWIHAERSIHKLVGYNEAQREALTEVRSQIWDFYAELKSYRETPCMWKKLKLLERFDRIFTTRTCYETLNRTLARIHKNKAELLLVLERPKIPLHNNAAETDIRELVRKRIISGSTRSELGRRCRDTFASLKKTCRKLGVSFWEYLKDRVSGRNSITRLPDLMRQRAGEAPG